MKKTSYTVPYVVKVVPMVYFQSMIEHLGLNVLRCHIVIDFWPLYLGSLA